MPEVSQYPSVSGIPELRKAVAAYLQRRFALSLDPDREILPCQGAKEALFHLPLAALDPARPLCWYPDPAYPVYERAILFAGGTPRTLPLRAERGFLPDLDAVPAADWRRTSIVYDNYPHNPTGAGAPRAHHEKLAALAKQHGFLLVCDEPYVDLYVHDPPHTALQVARENVLIVHSLSKRSGMTGYRSGFIAGEPDLIAQLREARANFGVAPQTMVQRAAVAAWSDDAHVEERRRVFADKRALILAHLRSLGLQVGGEGAFPRPQLRPRRPGLHPPRHGPHPGRLPKSHCGLANLTGLPAFHAERAEGAERAELFLKTDFSARSPLSSASSA